VRKTGQLVERSLRELATTRRPGGAGQADPATSVVVAGEIPQEPLGFQPRPDLLALLDAPGPGLQVRVVHALTGMRGVGKTHLAAAYARAKLADGWRVVAWINAEDQSGVLAGLAEVAAALGLAEAAGDARAAGRAVRHRLEADGERCLLVFDNATDPALLRPFLPAAGAARAIITSNQQSVANLGAGVAVDVFTEAEALTFLAARTGQADAAGARELAEELGCLPLALAQAAAVIAAQHLSYATYLDRLRRLPAADLLAAEEAGQYPEGVGAAVLLALDTVRAGNQGAACAAVMDLIAVLSAAGVRRSLIHAAAREGLPGRDESLPALAPEVADRVLAQLAGASLLTGSGPAASRHVASTVSVGTANGTCQGSRARSPNRADRIPVISLRHQARQQRRAQRRRHRHRPPGGALDFPPRDHLRRDLADHAGLPGHGIQLLLDHPEPGMVRGTASCLDPPVAAHHRRRDRHRLEEHHHLAGADLPGTLRRQRGPFPFPQRPAQRRPQVSDPHRDDPRTLQPSRPPVRDGSGSSGNRHGRVQRHEGLRGPEGASATTSLTGSPSQKPATTGKTLPACRIRRPATANAITHRSQSPVLPPAHEKTHLHGIAITPVIRAGSPITGRWYRPECFTR
jgi:hypothetical protein